MPTLRPTSADQPEQPSLRLHKPSEIKAFLDEHVVGQEAAKRTMAVAVMEGAMLDLMYRLPELREGAAGEPVSKVIITKDFVTEGKQPLYRYRRKSA